MSVVVWPSTNAYRGQTREGLLNKISEALRGRCKSAWLFGSFARGEERPGSDLDIIVVQDTTKNQFERVREYDDLWQIFPAIDLIVYAPGEFAQICSETAPGFRKSLVNEMVRLV